MNSNIHAQTTTDRDLARRGGVIFAAALVVLGPAVALSASTAPLATQVVLAITGSLAVVMLVALTAGIVGELDRARRSLRAALRRRQRSMTQEVPSTSLPQAA